MDFSLEKRIAAGDLKNIGSMLRDLPESFKGVVRVRMLREQKTYESDLVLQNGFIIGASIACSEDGAQLLGEKAFLGLVDLIKESSGGFAVYELADSEFKPYVAANESILLELVRNLGKTLEEIGHVDEDIRKEGLVDLESQWKELEAKWKQFEEREKPYLEMILNADLKDRSSETVTGGAVNRSQGEGSDNAGVLSSGVQAVKEIGIQAPSKGTSPAQSGHPSGNAGPERKSYNGPVKTDESGSSDEKSLDEMILREDPWEKISSGSVPGSGQEEKDGEKKIDAQSNVQESSETVQLRRELQGVFHGADTKEQKAETASSDKTLSDDFNERVRDAILGRNHNRLSENAVSAPMNDSMPDEKLQPAAEEAPVDHSPPAPSDQWLARANATLQRLKKKKLEGVVAAPRPGDIPNTDSEAVKQAESPPLDSAPPQDVSNRDDLEAGVSSSLDQESIIEKIKEASGEEWDEKTSSEISDLKKEVDVYWGWDKRKKRFVGIDGADAPVSSEKKPDEITGTVAPLKSKTPLAQCALLREEIKKQAADAREIVIKKEEVTEALLVAQAQPPPLPPMDVPQLKKKIGFMDKLKYAKYPQIIKIMEKVDGKKSLDDLARETKLTPAAIKYIIDKLVSDGYVIMKAAF
ncbi:MAG: winged helix-turn-helix domain-containing protein [Candidatus Altiarchaeia archaeon]